jgi:hypothetical protein
VQPKIVLFILLFASFSLVFSSFAYYSLSRPPAQEFIAWGVFSPSGTLSNYFSGGEANVTVGKTLTWHFAITNEMGSIQYVRVVYRLGNSTSPSPNATSPAGSVPELGSTEVFVPNSRTAVLNYTWKIASNYTQGGLVFMNLNINGQSISPRVGTVGGQKFRFFFELWTYDTVSGSFEYGYKGSSSRIGSPLQLWFNIV